MSRIITYTFDDIHTSITLDNGVTLYGDDLMAFIDDVLCFNSHDTTKGLWEQSEYHEEAIVLVKEHALEEFEIDDFTEERYAYTTSEH